mgnify:CR=1 FL=1
MVLNLFFYSVFRCPARLLHFLCGWLLSAFSRPARGRGGFPLLFSGCPARKQLIFFFPRPLG